MTREEAIMVLKNEQPHCGKKALFPEEKKYEAFNIAIKALEQKPCEDAISRQSLKRQIQLTIEDAVLNGANDVADVFRNVIDFIDGEPSVKPIRPRGHWIDEGWYAEGHSEHAYRCSECGQHIIEHPARLMDENPHCKFCGADMRESEERA